MNKPVVATLAFFYNQEIAVNRTLDSLLAQSYNDQYIIISDDASTDTTPQIIMSYEKALKEKFLSVEIYLHKENLGLKGRNNVKFVSSKIPAWSQYVQLLEDDEWEPNKTEMCVNFLELHPEHVMVHGEFVGRHTDGYITPPQWNFSGDDDQRFSYETLLSNNRIMTCTELCRVEAYKKAADYDLFTSHGILLGDYCTTLRLARMGKIGYINQVLATYRVDPHSTVNNPDTRGIVIADTIKLQDLFRSGKL